MRIIKHGKYFNPFPFHVPCSCGCEYEAEKSDGEIRASCTSRQTFFIVKCPECGEEFKHHIPPRFQYD